MALSLPPALHLIEVFRGAITLISQRVSAIEDGKVAFDSDAVVAVYHSFLARERSAQGVYYEY